MNRTTKLCIAECVAGRGILRNYGRNNNSPKTDLSFCLPKCEPEPVRFFNHPFGAARIPRCNLPLDSQKRTGFEGTMSGVLKLQYWRILADPMPRENFANAICSFLARSPLFIVLVIALFAVFSPSASAQTSPSLVHGLWVWKSPAVLAAPHAAESLRDFCTTLGINEVYVSVSARSEPSEEGQLAHLISLLHLSRIRVEALLDSADADEPGKHRDSLIQKVQTIIQFNQKHSADRFDGIHLDIEPQQRPENKGPGNLRFLPGLTDAFRTVRAVAEPAGMTVNADIQNKLLKGDATQRKMLLSSVPRLTLMMYELSSPGDGDTPLEQAEKAANNSQKFLNMAYEGLSGPNLARIVIALRTPDYLDHLPEMLEKLDDANRTNPHYLGWARHSYNDTLK
jgi:hypothetical protein